MSPCDLPMGTRIPKLIGDKQRESNKTIEVVESQLNAVLELTKDWTNIVIAYEPVWLARPSCHLLSFENF